MSEMSIIKLAVSEYRDWLRGSLSGDPQIETVNRILECQEIISKIEKGEAEENETA